MSNRVSSILWWRSDLSGIHKQTRMKVTLESKQILFWQVATELAKDRSILNGKHCKQTIRAAIPAMKMPYICFIMACVRALKLIFQ